MAPVGRGQAVVLVSHHPVRHVSLPQHRVNHHLERVADLRPGRGAEVDAALLVDRVCPGRRGRPAGAGVGGLGDAARKKKQKHRKRTMCELKRIENIGAGGRAV